MILALILFALMYVLLLTIPQYRHWTALISAGIFIALGILPAEDALPAVNWNVIMMLAGTMATVELFIESNMPKRIAEYLLKAVPNVQWAVVILSLFAGLISAFVDNVATVLMVAPVGLAVAKELKTNPIPVIVSIAVSSNLQGAATLVGDTTSILLGSYAHMSFNDFFWFQGRPGICLAVEAGALATIPVILFLFRKEKEPVTAEVKTAVTDHAPTVFLLATVGGLILASQFENKPELTNGFICIGIGIFGMIYERIRRHDIHVIKDVLNAIDWETLMLLCGLFMVIEGITQAGVIDVIAESFARIGGNNIFLMYTVIVFASVFLSAFVDNIPYVATMLPVVAGIAAIMGVEPYLFDYGLLIGATLGGNLTPVGASANIAGIGILRKEGYETSTKDFMRIGVPFTFTAVLVGYAVIWMIWA